MPPISTRRCTSLGSSPVVSVSRTISRISLRSAGSSGDGAQDRTDPALCMVKTEARLDEKMRTPALLRIGHLLRHYCAEFLLRHARTAEDALPLHRLRRRHEGDRVGLAFAAGLEKQRNVENEDGRLRVSRQKLISLLANERVDDALEGAQA